MINDYLMELAEFITLMENPSLIDVADALYIYIMLALILYALLSALIWLSAEAEKHNQLVYHPKNKSECRQAIAYWQEQLAKARARVYDSTADIHLSAYGRRQNRVRFRESKARAIAKIQSNIARLRAMMPELPDKDGNEQTITTINY